VAFKSSSKSSRILLATVRFPTRQIELDSRKLYQIVGIVCGFALIDYGFNFIALGLPGAREMTSQFIGVNLLLGGSVVIFISIFFLLRPAQTPVPTPPETGEPPSVGIETVVEEQTPPQFRFYRNIQYIGYFMTALGLFSAADLLLQVFVYQTYNEARWWVEILLVVFGMLAYAIFVSLGHIGAQEERALVTSQPILISANTATVGENVVSKVDPVAPVPEMIDLRLDQFSRLSSGEYERKLSGCMYDMVSVRPEVINVWRENRTEMRSSYLAGPYELSSEVLKEHAKQGEPIRIGMLSISREVVQELINMQRELQAQVAS